MIGLKTVSNIRYLSSYIENDQVYYKTSVYKHKEKSPLHSHDFYEIYYVLNGRINHFINGSELILEKGSLQFVNPLDVHSLEGGSSNESTILNFAFSTRVYNEIIEKLSFERFISNPPVRLESYQMKTMESFLNLLDKGDIDREEYLLYLIQNYSFLTRKADKNSVDSIVPHWLKKTLNQMETHTNLILGTERFVELSGKSHEHVSRVMKESCGMTITEWINTQKLERGRSLVLNSKMSIIDISLEVGYESESYFYRLYKKRYGVTPYKERLKFFSDN